MFAALAEFIAGAAEAASSEAAVAAEAASSEAAGLSMNNRENDDSIKAVQSAQQNRPSIRDTGSQLAKLANMQRLTQG